jgi:hypothetical protein
VDVRVLRDDLADGGRVREANRNDRVVPRCRKQRQPVLLGLVVLAVGRRKLFDIDIEVGFGLLQAGRRQVVERLVAAAADVVGQPDFDRLLGSRS